MGMISSFNEWDKIREIVVGSATYANWPTTDPVFALESEKTTWRETPVPSGPVPQWVIDETNEDLEGLVNILRESGATVYRPHQLNYQDLDGMYNYCPRDRLIVFGEDVIDPAMMYPCRDMELESLDFVVDSAQKVYTMPRDQGLVLDAANVLRLGPNKLLYLESPSGNTAAWRWLSENLPADTSIEVCNFYSGVHIDSTIVALREGLVMLNASRVTKENCPDVFADWEKIWVHDDDIVAQEFYQYPYASKWIAMNMLSIDPDTVIVDRHQTKLIKTLEQHKITAVPHELRHSRTLGGGFHCVTLDLVRK
jgi:N-dimethylarginine dimethylaminohydrolase